MANTLTNLIPTLYSALDVVSRELSGFIPSVARDSTADRAAKDQTVRWPIVPSMTSDDISAAATGPDPSAETIGSETITISNSKGVSFYWEGEEQVGLRHGGQLETILQGQFSQAMRTLVNDVEADIAKEYKKASRAHGTAGNAPFGSNLQDSAEMRKILDDNGAPMGDRSLVINTDAGVNLRKLAELSKANEAGSDDTLRLGTLLDLHGFAIRESAQIQSHSGGTATDVETDGDHDKGDTEITVKDAGSIDLNLDEGDVVTIGNYDYVVTEEITSAGDLKIAEPGLMEDVDGDTDVTVADDYDANMAFARSAIHLVTRAPAMPEGGDAADDVMEIQDPRTGLAFQVALYRQRRRIAYEVGLAWGQKLVKAEHTALLLG